MILRRPNNSIVYNETNRKPSDSISYPGGSDGGGGIPFGGTAEYNLLGDNPTTASVLYTLILKGEDALSLANGNRIVITLYTGDDTVIGWAEYVVGNTIGVDAPVASSLNWVADIIPNIVVGGTLNDGQLIGFNYMYMMGVNGYLNTNTSYTFKAGLQANESGSNLSVMDIEIINYNTTLIQYSTKKSGTHSVRPNPATAVNTIIDWGDGNYTTGSRSATSVNVDHTYIDATEKDVIVYFATTLSVGRFITFTQEITNIENFTATNCVEIIAQASSELTSIPAFFAPNCTRFDFLNCNINTLPNNVNPGVGRVDLSNNDLTTLNSTWDLSNVTDIRINNNLSLGGSVPINWLPSTLEKINANFCNFGTIPAVTLNSLTELQFRDNQLRGVPITTNSVQLIRLDGNDLNAIPSTIDHGVATDVRYTNNDIVILPASVDLSSIITLYVDTMVTFTTWDQPSISTTLTLLKVPATSLSQSQVDLILSQLRTSYDLLNRVITADLINTSVPSATGIADRDYLNGNGCVITTD